MVAARRLARAGPNQPKRARASPSEAKGTPQVLCVAGFSSGGGLYIAAGYEFMFGRY
jgi:hypothetical protein